MSEAFFRIPVGEGEYELSRDNTSLFRHLGAAAVYDHVFVQQDKSGAYIWRTHSQFEEIQALVEEQKCTMHLNIQEPADIDVKNYIAHHTAELGADELTVPEGWSNA